MQVNRSRGTLTLIGASLVAAFFLPWIDLGVASLSGFDLVRARHVELLTRILILGVPLTGLGLMAAAATGERRTRALAIVTGLGILGYTSFEVARSFLKITGYGLWIVLGCAVAALVTGLALPAGKSSSR
jgi:hypothetical protein